MVAMLTRDIVCLVGWETTPGTRATNLRPLRINGAALPLADLAREMLANERSSVYQHDNAPMILGLKRRAPVKVPMLLQYTAAQLNSASSAPPAIDASTEPSQSLFLAHWLGGRLASQGSTIAGSGSTTSTLDVATGHGSRFTVGQIVIPYIGGVAQPPRKVTAIATDTLTIFPEIASAPAAAQVVLGSRTYYRAEAMTATLSLRAANVESGTPEAQQEALMVRGQCAMTMEIGGTVGLAFDGVAQTWNEGNLSISYADVADDMGDEVVWAGASYLWDTTDSADPEHTCIEAITVTVPNTWHEQPCMSGVEGAVGVVMTGGRTPATVELTMSWERMGAGMVTAYEAGDTFGLLAYATRGSGTAQRWAGWYAPKMAFDAKPQRVDKEGEVKVVCKFRCLADTNAAGSPLSSSSTDAERSPISFFYA